MYATGGLAYQTRDIPELLTTGNEREYLSWHYRGLAYNREAITETDIDTYVSDYSSPGGMRAGFEYYRAFPLNAEQNKVLSETKLQIPVLAIGGDIYPALGGDLPGNITLNSTQALAAKCDRHHSSTVRALHCGRTASFSSKVTQQFL